MKDAAAQPSVDEHPVDDETIQNWSICVRVPQRDTVSVRRNNRQGRVPARAYGLPRGLTVRNGHPGPGWSALWAGVNRGVAG